MTKKFKQDDWIDVDDAVALYKSTTVYSRMINRFEREVIKQVDFQDEIQRIRTKYKIAITPDKKSMDFLVDISVTDTPIDKEITQVCRKYKIVASYFVPVIRYYLFYNEIKYPYGTGGSLCMVKDILDIEGSSDDDDDEDEMYPIAIKLSPYANKTAIREFIDKVYSIQIEPIQKKYKGRRSSAFTSRTRPTSEQCGFCFENCTLPRDDLLKLVKEKFPNVLWTKTYLSQVIYYESKKRHKM